jgi:integrator complex subunit 5
MARAVTIRELLEGALFSYGSIFIAQHTTDDNVRDNDKDKNDELLVVLNQKQGIGLNVSRSSVLHSGVIGRGPKTATLQTNDPEGPDKDIKNLFLNALVACCGNYSNPETTDQTTLDGFSFVSLLLVEMVSTDVMYNGLPWPDEEFTKVTMERDLQIRRSFKNIPILWSILGLIATYRPSLCYCSVLLRALCATVLHQWKAKSGMAFSHSLNFINFSLMFCFSSRH